MYRSDSWTIKKSEYQRTDAFEVWCLRRLLRISWTARKSDQSILNKINPEYSLKRLMLMPQYFGYLMWRANSLKKTLMLETIEGKGRHGEWDGWMPSPTQWTWVLANSGRWWRTGKPGGLQSIGSHTVRHDWSDLACTQIPWLNSFILQIGNITEGNTIKFTLIKHIIQWF